MNNSGFHSTLLRLTRPVEPPEATAVPALLRWSCHRKVTAGDICTFKAAAFTDLAGNNTVAAVTATFAADTTAPTASISSATCVDQAQNALTAGNLTMTAVAATAGGANSGAKGNPYSLIVKSTRGKLMPVVTVDDTAKTITVDADASFYASGVWRQWLQLADITGLLQALVR